MAKHKHEFQVSGAAWCNDCGIEFGANAGWLSPSDLRTILGAMASGARVRLEQNNEGQFTIISRWPEGT